VHTERVSLRHLTSGPLAVVALREPNGRDEMAVEGVDTRSAVALLERLLNRAGPEPLRAAQLSARDRDALLAALHRQLWGDRIVATLTCIACASRFDLSFDLSAVQRHVADPASAWRATGDGHVARDGAAYRVPTAEDELTVIFGSAAEAATRLAARCGATPPDVETAAAALQAAAPIIDIDLNARCTECAHEQSAHFDVQSFVLQRLLNERAALLTEIHLLAELYGWSLREILALARSTRRALAGIAGEARSGSRAPARREVRR
jgi:hypothetical protein